MANSSPRSYGTLPTPFLVKLSRNAALPLYLSYSPDRTQTTTIDSSISAKFTSTCGVPQGSVLGPLLFLLHVNNINNCSSKLNFFLFADENNIFSDKNLRTLEMTF